MGALILKIESDSGLCKHGSSYFKRLLLFVCC